MSFNSMNHDEFKKFYYRCIEEKCYLVKLDDDPKALPVPCIPSFPNIPAICETCDALLPPRQWFLLFKKFWCHECILNEFNKRS